MKLLFYWSLHNQAFKEEVKSSWPSLHSPSLYQWFVRVWQSVETGHTPSLVTVLRSVLPLIKLWMTTSYFYKARPTYFTCLSVNSYCLSVCSWVYPTELKLSLTTPVFYSHGLTPAELTNGLLSTSNKVSGHLSFKYFLQLFL